MKKLFSCLALAGLLLGTGCAHHSKCGGQCEVKKGDSKCCCSGEKAQCDMKKKEEKKG